eukprot:2701890-Rhodomonas_salina.1
MFSTNTCLPYDAIALRVSYAMSGTDIAYGATRPPTAMGGGDARSRDDHSEIKCNNAQSQCKVGSSRFSKSYAMCGTVIAKEELLAIVLCICYALSGTDTQRGDSDCYHPTGPENGELYYDPTGAQYVYDGQEWISTRSVVKLPVVSWTNSQTSGTVLGQWSNIPCCPLSQRSNSPYCPRYLLGEIKCKKTHFWYKLYCKILFFFATNFGVYGNGTSKTNWVEVAAYPIVLRFSYEMSGIDIGYAAMPLPRNVRLCYYVVARCCYAMPCTDIVDDTSTLLRDTWLCCYKVAELPVTVSRSALLSPYAMSGTDIA